MKRFSLFVPALVGAVAAGALSASAQIILTGSYIQAGVSTGDGHLIDDGGIVGLKFDKTGSGVFPAWDYVTPGTPWEAFTLNIGGVVFPVSARPTGNPYGFSTTDHSTPGLLYSTVTKGNIPGTTLFYTSTLTFGQKADHINIRTDIANDGAVPVTDIYFARGCDPDQDVLAGGGFSTANVVSGDVVKALGHLTPTGEPWLAVWDVDSQGVVGTLATWGGAEDAKAMFLTPGGSGEGDWEIYAAFYRASLAPHESVSWQFDYIVPEPSQYAMLAGLGLVGFAAYRRFKKA